MMVVRSLSCVPVLLGLRTDAAASQPPIVPPRDVCDPAAPGDSILDARIVSFEQPRYTCGPYQSTTQGWTEALVNVDPRHAPLRPTATSGCILTSMSTVVLDASALGDRAIDDPANAQIELRVDDAPRTVPYANLWEVCGLAPGHHAIEVATDRGPLRCEGDVRPRETLTLAATSYGAILHIEPTRLVSGAPRLGQPLTVEYDELNYGPRVYRPRYDDFPPSAILRVWTSPDGVLRAESCPPRPALPPPPPPPPKAAPRPVAPGGCAHCAVGPEDPSAPTFVALLVLALVLMNRKR
jgi:MYXO-CTERM domain-containing protein